ncbi:hypothetical protein Ciccas_011221 [Cichlidogyrus casuarinus]|uniref:Uncharacterized protein n=1 Tax=Cichlidogyrus casuarinus TaxID=1844966 RepID=A0ABD2PRW8_9PLAT
MLLRQIREQRRQQRMALQETTNTNEQKAPSKPVVQEEPMEVENRPLTPAKSILKNSAEQTKDENEKETTPAQLAKETNPVPSPKVENPAPTETEEDVETEKTAIASADIDRDRMVKNRALSDIDINTTKPVHFRTSSDNQIQMKDSSNESSSNGTLTNGVSTESIPRSNRR